MTHRTTVMLALTAAPLALLSGCSMQRDDEFALLEQANYELREENHRLRDQYQNASSTADRQASEIRALEAEKSVLSLSQTTARNPSTGFEGIAGVESRTLSGGAVVLDVAGDVLFSAGSASLRSAAKKTLDAVARELKNSYSGRLIRIGGHTDKDPIKKSGWKTNERLSAERALAVEEYLAERGVAPSSMYVAGFGPAHPKATKQTSRRVEILVLSEPAP